MPNAFCVILAFGMGNANWDKNVVHIQVLKK